MRIAKSRENGDGTHDIIVGARQLIIGLILLSIPPGLAFLGQHLIMGANVSTNSVHVRKYEPRVQETEKAQAVIETRLQHIDEGIQDIKNELKER